MRKSGWTVAAGLSSLVLLLTACGGSSSSTSATGAASSAVTQGTVSSSSTAGPTSSSTSSKSTAKAKATSSSSSSKQTAEARPSTNPGVTFPAVGTTVLIVQHSNLGWVMATAKGIVVYTYAKDSKGGPPTCTGSCASVWAPVTGVPKAGPADNFPGTFGESTVGLNVMPVPWINIRPEVRGDFASSPVLGPLSDHVHKKNQLTMGGDIIFKF